MTIDTNFLDESNRLMTERITPTKTVDVKEIAPVSPESSDSSVSGESSASSDDGLSPISPRSFQREDQPISDHKRAEEAGLHAEEPLLKENPKRFVLFPIEDNDVSQCICHF